MKRAKRQLAFLAGVVAALMAVVVLAASAGDITGTVKARGRDNADAVVYVEAIAGKTFPPPGEKTVIDQKRMVFVPHVAPVLVGTTVEFRNSDSVLHNVFTPSAAGDKFNLGSWPAGQTKDYTFKKPGVVALLCNVHPEMAGFVVVVETPYFAVSDSTGNYTIKNVPPGTYRLSAWHERAKKTSTQEVKVPASGSVTADFDLRR